MLVVSVNVGRPRLFSHHGQQYSTAIQKLPVDGPCELTPLGFVGDKQADTEHHGGPHQAVCAYPHENYRPVGQFLQTNLTIPSFGENLTTHGLIETEVCIGDSYRIGGAVLQITKPREPCSKLARKHDSPALGPWIHQTAFTGFYLRVLETGPVAAGDPINLLDRPHPAVTVAQTMHAMFEKLADPHLIAVLAEHPLICPRWRDRFARKRAVV